MILFVDHWLNNYNEFILKTIEKYLGKDFKVVSSVGHIRDLSTSGKYGFGVDIDNNFKPDYIVNVGVAGGLNPMLSIGDIVIGETLVQHDFDITAFGHAKGYIPGVGEKIYADDYLVKKIEEAIGNQEEKVYKYEKGVIASGDIFCTAIPMRDKIYAKFNAECVEMEGAAIGQVCSLCNVPFVVIRSISDTPNGENEVTYEKFIKLASERCANILKDFVKTIE